MQSYLVLYPLLLGKQQPWIAHPVAWLRGRNSIGTRSQETLNTSNFAINDKFSLDLVNHPSQVEGEALCLADPGPVPGRVGHLGGLLGQRPVRERRPQRRQALQGCKSKGQ